MKIIKILERLKKKYFNYIYKNKTIFEINIKKKYFNYIYKNKTIFEINIKTII